MRRIDTRRSKGLAEIFSCFASDEIAKWFSKWLGSIGEEEFGWYFLPSSQCYRSSRVHSLLARDAHVADQLALHACVNASIFVLRRFLSEELLSDGNSLGGIERSRFQAGSAILLYMEKLSTGVFETISSDNDIVTRILTRSFAEASDFLLMTIIDDEACNRFVDRGLEFRQIFHSHFSRKKLVAARKKALVECFGLDADYAHEHSLAYQNELELFSQYVHPSYEAGATEVLYSDLVARESHGEWAFLGEWRAGRAMELFRHSALPALMLAATYFSITATFEGHGKLGNRIVSLQLVGACRDGLFDAANLFL